MPVLKKLVIPLLTVVMLLANAPLVSANSTTTQHYQTTIPVSFVLTPENCPNLQVTVTGTGVRSDVVDVISYGDGSGLFIDVEVDHGTAVDSNGSTYRFNYDNHKKVNIPPDGTPVHMYMTDYFILVGNGNTNSIHVGFNWRWTAQSLQELWPPITFENINTRESYLNCDPL